MFTGIIEQTGIVRRLRRGGLVIDAGKLSSRLKKGDSIAVNGVCLTVVRKSRSEVHVNLAAETLDRTNLAQLKEGERANLELPMTASSFISGHFVQGHVEGVGTVTKWIRLNEDVRLFVALPKDLLPYCIHKGSIALNGVSLTIARMNGRIVQIALIPYTLAHTNLGDLVEGDRVNIETDMIGRYVVSAWKKQYHRRSRRDAGGTRIRR